MTALLEQEFAHQLLEALDVPLSYLVIPSPTTTLVWKVKQRSSFRVFPSDTSFYYN